ncbi:hypothetical protein [Ileibacterium valens]|uniref:hypothetical protein n=1 Tax=Ileibacterium valens TaxID=1862668 RepID=UPI0027297E12|nr:hypothetical protein [Ileibacterium valens]
MDYMKAQKLICDSAGHILSGSASIVVPVYDPSAGFRTKKVVRERLGKVLFLCDDKKTGIFLSPTRGLVEYDSSADEFGMLITMIRVWK